MTWDLCMGFHVTCRYKTPSSIMAFNIPNIWDDYMTIHAEAKASLSIPIANHYGFFTCIPFACLDGPFLGLWQFVAWLYFIIIAIPMPV